MQSESIKEICVALIAVQNSLKPVERDGTANYGKYMTLGAITEAVRPLLVLNGLAVVQMPTTLEDGSSGLCTTLLHVSGEWISETMPLLLSKSDPQSQGGGISYARRYALAALLQVVQDDDDAVQATQSRQQYQQRQSAPNKQETGEIMPSCPHCGTSQGVGYSKTASGYYCFPRQGGCGKPFEAAS